MPETQTNQQTKPAAKSSGGSVLDEVDSLAGEFDATPTAPKQPDPLREYAKRKMHEETVTEFKTAVDSAVADLTSSDILKSLPKRFAKGFLYSYAEENPGFDKAFKARKENPDAWKAALAQATKVAESEFKTPDSKITSDIEAAKAAVRGSSSTPPPAPDMPDNDEMTSWSDAKFAQYKRSLDAKNRRRAG